MEHLHQMAMKCKQAARELALYDTETKNRALLAVAQALEDNMASILSANARDIAYARDNGLREAMIDRLGLGKGQQVWPIGLHSELTQLYRRAIEIAADNKTAPQPLLAGIVQHMIGLLNYLLRNRTGHATDLLEQSVEKAKIIMDERVSGEIDLYDLASELNLSYSWFRKTFNEYTGHSPARYFQLLKLRRAQRLL